MLFLGDFIYIDIPKILGLGLEDYQRLYRQVYASPSWSQATRDLPWLHVLDDHEIIDNWSANNTGVYKQAIQPYRYYQHAANLAPVHPGATYYTFSHGGVAFFVLGTRSHRSAADLDDGPTKSMLGVSQRQHLEDWLATEPKWKVVVSSVPFTRNWRTQDFNDNWAGYLWERQRLLERMWETDGVIVISGVSF
jgi:alkaline phosphatase D